MIRKSCWAVFLSGKTHNTAKISITADWQMDSMNALHTLQSCVATIFDADGCDADVPLARIHVMGANRLLNQTLVLTLKKTFGAICTYGNGLDLERAVDPQAEKPAILLVDCLTWDLPTVTDRINSHMGSSPIELAIVLFNVDAKDKHVEKLGPPIVHGIFYHDDTRAHFLEGMAAIMNGQHWFTRCDKKRLSKVDQLDQATESTQGQVVPISELQILSRREIEILKCIADGMSNTSIADELKISPHTVKTHVYNIFKKIKVPNRLQAALWYTSHL